MSIYFSVCAAANEFTAPSAPEIAEKYLPPEIASFGDGVWYVIKQGLQHAAPNLSQAAGICCSIIAIAILISVVDNLFGVSQQTSHLVGVVAVSALLLNTAGTLIALGAETVQQISAYGKLLLPVLSTALAAQGGGGSAVLLYTGTIVFNTILTSVLSKVLIPGIYIYLGICIANRALSNETLSNMAKFIKGGITWVLKTALYVFTGYMTVTGVVSGSVDAASIKAAKLAISGTVPVIGSILSDASESFLAGVSIAKNAAGVTGLLTILAIWIGPFFQLGLQYIILKLSGTVCGAINGKGVSELVGDYSTAMGLLLAATGAIGFIHLFSTVCFIRGVA